MEALTPTQTVTFICGVIMCVIGIATFISALLTRARKDGQLEYKVDEALRGIEEIKSNLYTTNAWKESTGIKIQSHEERIVTLFNEYHDLEERIKKLERR